MLLSSRKQPALQDVAIVTAPLTSQSAAGFIDNLVQAVRHDYFHVTVLAGNFPYSYEKGVTVVPFGSKGRPEKKRSIWSTIIDSLSTQFQMAYHVWRQRNAGIILFYMWGHFNVLALLCAKLRRQKVVVFHLGGNKLHEASLAQEVPSWLKGPYLRVKAIAMAMSYSIADKIVCESESGIKFAGLEKYRQKLFVNGGRYVDTNVFRIDVPLKNRQDVVGFIGRLTEVKGVVHLIEAVPKILEAKDAEFIIIGDGDLARDLRTSADKLGVLGKVTFTGWKAHEELPAYLNQFKILVLPSFTEGVPGALQEAMACGAVVLATPVGGVPDYIQDGITGFVLETNSPACIKESVVRVLDHPALNQVSLNARRLVEEKCTLKSVRDRYEKLFALLGMPLTEA